MKERLDIFLVKKGLVKNRSKASDLIKRGKVKVNNTIATKQGSQTADTAQVEVDNSEEFVSRGGTKLAHALEKFNINPLNMTCIDIGSSTGGFTDCLLHKGASKIYAIDVGTDQFDSSLKGDARVILMEQTDIRNADIPELADLIVIDVSFISLALVLPEAFKYLKKDGCIITLVKPQFEVGKEHTKNGIVRDEVLQQEAVSNIKQFGEKLGLIHKSQTESPISGGDGNKEYFIHFATI